MLTRADFCVYSESGYKGHMACPKSCWYQGGCTCKEAIEKFRQFLNKKSSSNTRQKNRRYR